MRITRTTALAATVLVSLLGPGPAAVAQDSYGLSVGVPPPWNGGGPPSPGPANSTTGVPAGSKYQLSQACVTSQTPEGVQLKAMTNGQAWLRLDQAHQYATGRGQTVAVIDTGVNSHPYLGARLSHEVDFLSGVAQVNRPDCDGHGTEVAGIIAANTPSGIGFDGVAPDAQILPIRQSSDVIQVTPPGGQAQTAGTPASLTSAIVTAVDDNASVINMSLSACLTNDSQLSDQVQLQNAIHWAVAVRHVVLVAAAGNVTPDSKTGCAKQNDNPNPNAPYGVESPAWFSPDVLSVAAIATDNKYGQQTGQPATFTMWGPWVSVAAPGTSIVSLDPASPGLVNQVATNGQVGPIQGTSFAAPYVAGLAALVKQKFPWLDAYQVMHRIEMTAQHPAAPGGRDNQIGYGMIDPVAALTAVLPGEPKSPQAADGVRIQSDVGVAASKSASPMVIALLGTLVGVALLLVTLFIVHATNRARGRQTVTPSRLRI